MALDFLNRCIFTATSGGTGAFEVASPVNGFLAPSSAGAEAGRSYRYFAQSDDLSQWEVGTGEWDGTELTRNVLQSSNSNAVVTFSAAPKVHMGGPLAGDMPGWQVISEGEVTVPITELVVQLPSEYRRFNLMLDGLQTDIATGLLLAVSYDGGATRWEDQSGSEYCYVFKVIDMGAVNSNVFSEIYLDGGFWENDRTPVSTLIDILPGSAAVPASLFWTTAWNPSGVFSGVGLMDLRTHACSAIQLVSGDDYEAKLGRINAVNFSPWANDSAELIAGSYRLLGWPS